MKADQKRRKDIETDFLTYPSSYKALEVAIYYGFSYVEQSVIEKSDREAAKAVQHSEGDPVMTEEKISLLRRYFKENLPPLPLMIVHERAFDEKKKEAKYAEFHLDILGTNRSIADATIIKTAYECVRAEGYTDLNLEINSIGDKDSLNRFTKELTAYFRKHINELDPECRQLLKKSPFAIMNCVHEKCLPLKDQMPQPMNYLSEISRSHFMELLEVIEALKIPYSINGSLINNLDIANHTLFKIYGTLPENNTPQVVASGFRWSGLAKKIGYKKDIQGVSATIQVPKAQKQEFKMKKIAKPQAYFIQMGIEAKLKSLLLIELLREAKILIYHSLTKDKLTAQLASAENLAVPFILIMGQKESLDNTILVREMTNRSQDTVKLTAIAEYLKKALDKE